MLSPIKALLDGFHSHLINDLNANIDDLKDLFVLIDSAIAEEPPISSRDGDIIKTGYNEEVDRLRAAKIDGKKWLADLEAKEREKTGIKNLKIKFNKVFGFYLEVTNSYKDLVPDYYVRKQTLANAERYYTPELKELEDSILGAEDRLNTIEYEFFKSVRDTIAGEVDRIQISAKAIATLDAIISLAVVSEKNHYVKPVINNRGVIDIKEGRHPVVEQMINADQFISNDCYLDLDTNTIVSLVNSNRDYAFYTNVNLADKSKKETMLVNKYYSLSKDYVPELVTLNESYTTLSSRATKEVSNAFSTMVEDAKKQNLTIYCQNGYRSYDSQNYIFNDMRRSKGDEYTNLHEARAGFSEYQTGLSLELIHGKNQNQNEFKDSKEFAWLKENAYKYGFILRYPEGKENITGFAYKPYYFRYVGKNPAKTIWRENITLEEYYAYYEK